MESHKFNPHIFSGYAPESHSIISHSNDSESWLPLVIYHYHNQRYRTRLCGISPYATSLYITTSFDNELNLLLVLHGMPVNQSVIYVAPQKDLP